MSTRLRLCFFFSSRNGLTGGQKLTGVRTCPLPTSWIGAGPAAGGRSSGREGQGQGGLLQGETRALARRSPLGRVTKQVWDDSWEPGATREGLVAGLACGAHGGNGDIDSDAGTMLQQAAGRGGSPGEWVNWVWGTVLMGVV